MEMKLLPQLCFINLLQRSIFFNYQSFLISCKESNRKVDDLCDWRGGNVWLCGISSFLSSYKTILIFKSAVV